MVGADSSDSLRADPNAAWRSTSGVTGIYDRQYERAETHARRSLRLDSNDFDCRMSMGYLLVPRGRAKDALGYMDQAVRPNPFTLFCYAETGRSKKICSILMICSAVVFIPPINV
ncbi:hypothetical protein BN77_p11292 [Rhizobium mesoamericanum STM3625]|uniref:Uncharacterized protein n=1 Tax=Rhizobium mesoamericanum STM3625 TaxID=1211777 RepID=K0Q2B9_9HYPH|nr:hypothetical protein BN77_p11292 [Rhizobium mesoamericanum STM3625]